MSPFCRGNPLSIKAAAKEYPSRLALRTPERDYSFAEMAELVENRLQTISRPEPGRPFALVAQASLETLVTLYALFEARIPVLMLHPNLTDFEREALLAQASTIEAPVPADIAAILFTSGTTGRPKPAMVPHQALVASAKAGAQNLGWEENDIWQLSISPARIGGLSIVTRTLMARRAMALTQHFSPDTFIQRLETDRITLVSIVPTMLVKILERYPDWTPPKTLRALLLGGASATPSLLEKARERHLPVITTYGMTETASNVVTTPYAERYDGAVGSGKPNAGVDVTIRDGLIMVKGEVLMAGYWGAAPLDRTDWFVTGDIGYFDDNGYLHVQARRTDLIITGGENVYPAEVEAALEDIPGIQSAMVLGREDDTWGATVTALVVAQDSPIDADRLVESLKPRLATYKCPRLLAWVEKLPETAGGKLNRHQEVLEGLTFQTLHYR